MIGGAAMPLSNHRDATINSHCYGPEPLPSTAFKPLDETISAHTWCDRMNKLYELVLPQSGIGL